MDSNDPRIEIWRDLLRGQRAMMLRLTARLKRDFDLTTAQYEALQSLHRTGGTSTAARLARELLYSSGSATHLFSRLEERGLVTRSGSPADGRVVNVSLTPAGASLVATATAAHITDIQNVFVPLVHENELPALRAFAHRLAAAEGLEGDASRT